MNKYIITREVKGETDPWQALASAIIIRAVKDYRSYTRKMNRIKQRLNTKRKLSEESIGNLKKLYAYYELERDEVGDFFFTKFFASLTKINGQDLIERLNQEEDR